MSCTWKQCIFPFVSFHLVWTGFLCKLLAVPLVLRNKEMVLLSRPSVCQRLTLVLGLLKDLDGHSSLIPEFTAARGVHVLPAVLVASTDRKCWA